MTLWSLNAVVAKVVLDSAELSAFRLAEVRATGSALILVTFVLILNPASMRIGRRELFKLAVFGVLGLGVVQLFYFVGIRRLDIGIALVINYLAPVFVALWARFYVHEPVRRRLWFSIALSLFGLTLVVELWGGSSLDWVGVAACMVTAVAYAAYVLMAEQSLAARPRRLLAARVGLRLRGALLGGLPAVVELSARHGRRQRPAARTSGRHQHAGLAPPRLHRRSSGRSSRS